MNTKVQEITEKYGQQQLLLYWDTLSEQEKEQLTEDIFNIDFPLMDSLYKNVGSGAVTAGDISISPMPCTDATSMTEQEKERLCRKGMGILMKGKMAALTMAGGQGSRLGHDGPKGTYDIGLPSGKSLFEIQCDGLKKVSIEAGRVVRWLHPSLPEFSPTGNPARSRPHTTPPGRLLPAAGAQSARISAGFPWESPSFRLHFRVLCTIISCL